MKIPIKNKYALLLTLILILMSATSAFASPSSEEILAEHLLAITGTINPGTTRQTEATSMFLPFQQIESVDNRQIGGRTLTRVSFHIDNEGTRAVTRTPYTTIDFSLTFEKGIVVEKTVRIYVSSGYAAAVLERKRGFGFQNGIVRATDRSRYVDHNWQSDTHMGRIDVTDDSSLALTKRKADWQVNVGCLSRLGGCTDARQLITLSREDLTDPGHRSKSP